MSNYHILAGNKDGNSFQIAMHVPVPDVANEVGLNYRAVLIQWRSVEGTMPQSAVPFIDPAEQAQLDAGELYEYGVRFHTYPGQALAQKRDRLDTLYLEIAQRMQDELRKMLGYWGFSHDVT